VQLVDRDRRAIVVEQATRIGIGNAPHLEQRALDR
jgi:hypothetical protein